MGSLVVACRIWFPDQGLNSGPLHWEHGVLTTRPPGRSLSGLFFLNNFIYFWLCWVFVLHGLFPSCSGYSLAAVHGLLTAVVSLWSTGSRERGPLSLQLLGPRAQAEQVWCVGLVVPGHVGSFQIKEQTRVSCLGRWILMDSYC